MGDVYYKITGGLLDGESIGVTEAIGPTIPAYGFFSTFKEAYRNQTGELEFFQSNFEDMIDVTEVIMSGTYWDEKIAAVNIVDDDNNITGRFCIEIVNYDTSTSRLTLTGYIEDPQGTIISYVGTSASGAQQVMEQPYQPNYKMYLCLCVWTNPNNNKKYVGWIINGCTMATGGATWKWGDKYWLGPIFPITDIYTLYGIHGDLPKPKKKSNDPYIKTDPNGTTDDIPKGDKKRGGDGTHDYSTHIIPLPTLPTFTATKTGFVTLYRCTEAILRTLADKLFSDTWAGALDNFFQNADEVIAGLSIVPFQPPVSGRAKPRVGLNVLDVAMDVISSQYVEIDCGELDIEEFYGSAFDYSPYTKISIYLPYVGVRSLDVDEVMAHRIGVKYYCDAYSGCCMACIYVYVDPQTGEAGDQPSLKYTFSGNIAQQVPTASQSWDRMIQSGIALACVALPAIAAAGAAVGSGLMSAGIYQASTQGASMYGTSQYAKNAMVASWESAGSGQASMALEGATMATGMSAKPTVERTGSLGSGVGFLGPQKPFLILEIPRQSIPFDYMSFKGYPSNESATLGELEGFVQVEDIHLTEVYATGPEKDEIMRLLKEGVIL